MCRLITGMPSSSSAWRKKGIWDQFSGMKRLNTSTGMALTYSSASTTSPERSLRCFTLPSSLVTISATGALVCTLPPCLSITSTMGAHTRSGWLPSRKAICKPSVSLRKRFIAVSTTTIDSLSGSMKSSALAMEMNTSVLMRSGMPYLRMKFRHDSSSWRSMKSWPSTSMGSRAGMHWIFSFSESILSLVKMASPKLKGAGIPLTKLKLVNSPGSSCIAKIIW
mmetsp:Transcript_26995/g.51441  ORF Transcript_26995/g.51441 Transcript_26995/m.51441 type:complete len:223 (-) Transcript_26995:446-1114(-)